MLRKPTAAAICILIVSIFMACQLVSPVKAPASDHSTAFEATAASLPQPTLDSTATSQAAETAAAGATATAQSAAQAASAASTAAAVGTFIAKSDSATQTAAAAQAAQRAQERIARTATVEYQTTQQAKGMYAAVNQLYKDGALKSDIGSYYALQDFNESWAQLGWYQWWKTGYSPSNFVLRAHTAWESASKVADWYASGCGFVFREADADNHYIIFLALDGNIYLQGFVKGEFRQMGREYAGRIEHLKGEADVMLVVTGDHISYYINGKKIFERANNTLASGDLAMTLVSGTNKDFGIRCTITDIELWDLGK